MTSTVITLSDVAEAITELEIERRTLYAESFGISREQRELVHRFQTEMRECSKRQRIVAEKLAAIEITVEKMLRPL